MFNIENATTQFVEHKGYSGYFKGIIVVEANRYKVKHKGIIYPIAKIDRIIGQTIYSTHNNNKHPLGTKRSLTKLTNLDIINKYWYVIYKGMNVYFKLKDDVAILNLDINAVQ